MRRPAGQRYDGFLLMRPLLLGLLLLACSPAIRQYELEHGYTIRHEESRSVLLFDHREITETRFSVSPSGRYVLFRDYGNFYLFDSSTQKTRFLRRAPFSCMDKWYEKATPPVVRCFDVYNNRMIEMPLQ